MKNEEGENDVDSNDHLFIIMMVVAVLFFFIFRISRIFCLLFLLGFLGLCVVLL